LGRRGHNRAALARGGGMISRPGSSGHCMDHRSSAQRWCGLTDTGREPRGESLEASRRLECVRLTSGQSTDIGVEVVDTANAVCADVLQACATQDSGATPSQRKALLPSSHIHSPCVCASCANKSLGVAS